MRMFAAAEGNHLLLGFFSVDLEVVQLAPLHKVSSSSSEVVSFLSILLYMDAVTDVKAAGVTGKQTDCWWAAALFHNTGNFEFALVKTVM